MNEVSFSFYCMGNLKTRKEGVYDFICCGIDNSSSRPFLVLSTCFYFETYLNKSIISIVL